MIMTNRYYGSLYIPNDDASVLYSAAINRQSNALTSLRQASVHRRLSTTSSSEVPSGLGEVGATQEGSSQLASSSRLRQNCGTVSRIASAQMQYVQRSPLASSPRLSPSSRITIANCYAFDTLRAI